MRVNADAFLALPLSDGAKRGILDENAAEDVELTRRAASSC